VATAGEDEGEGVAGGAGDPASDGGAEGGDVGPDEATGFGEAGPVCAGDGTAEDEPEGAALGAPVAALPHPATTTDATASAAMARLSGRVSGTRITSPD
jgi:hypothetical protein